MNKELLQKILRPLHQDNPTGEAIRYTPLYDQIQEARRFEDETLPRGIWETEIKKADWLLVTTLCTKGLVEQSKDLYLAGWLTEGLIELHGLAGLSWGVDLIQGLSEAFWENLHPQIDPEDPIQRLAPYEWIDHQFPTTLLQVDVTSTLSRDLKNFSFADWLQIQHLEVVSKKQKDPNSYLQKEFQKGAPNPSFVRESIRSTSSTFYQEFFEKTKEIFGKIERLERFLNERIQGESIFFHNLKKQLEALGRFSLQGQKLAQGTPPPKLITQAVSSNKIEENKENVENPQQSSFSEEAPVEAYSREKAYMHLGILAEFLSKVDPHSPTPYLLRKAITWQNKTLLDVLQEFRKDPHALQFFLTLLDVPTTPQ